MFVEECGRASIFCVGEGREMCGHVHEASVAVGSHVDGDNPIPYVYVHLIGFRVTAALTALIAAYCSYCLVRVRFISTTRKVPLRAYLSSY